MFNEGFVSVDRRHPGPRPGRRRGLAGRRGRHRGAARGRGVGAGRAADHPARPGRRPLRRARRAGAAAPPGPVPLGPRRDRRGRAADRAGRRAAPPRPLPAPGRDRRAARHRAVVGGDRLAADRDAVRRARPARPLPRRAAQPGRGPRPARRTRPRRWPSSTRSPTGWRRTTSSTRPAPSCSPRWAATTRPATPTAPRSASPATTPSAGCSPPGCTGTRWRRLLTLTRPNRTGGSPHPPHADPPEQNRRVTRPPPPDACQSGTVLADDPLRGRRVLDEHRRRADRPPLEVAAAVGADAAERRSRRSRGTRCTRRCRSSRPATPAAGLGRSTRSWGGARAWVQPLRCRAFNDVSPGVTAPMPFQDWRDSSIAGRVALQVRVGCHVRRPRRFRRRGPYGRGQQNRRVGDVGAAPHQHSQLGRSSSMGSASQVPRLQWREHRASSPDPLSGHGAAPVRWSGRATSASWVPRAPTPALPPSRALRARAAEPPGRRDGASPAMSQIQRTWRALPSSYAARPDSDAGVPVSHQAPDSVQADCATRQTTTAGRCSATAAARAAAYAARSAVEVAVRDLLDVAAERPGVRGEVDGERRPRHPGRGSRRAGC